MASPFGDAFAGIGRSGVSGEIAGERRPAVEQARRAGERVQVNAQQIMQADAECSVWRAIYLLLAAEIFLVCLLFLDGFGHPDEGFDFFRGSAVFRHDVAEILNKAEPDLDDGWNSDAALRYLEVNAEMREMVNFIADIDQKIFEELRARAGGVRASRQALMEILVGVTLALELAYYLYGQYEAQLSCGDITGAAATANLLLIFSYVAATGAAAMAMQQIIMLGEKFGIVSAGKFTVSTHGYRAIVEDASNLVRSSGGGLHFSADLPEPSTAPDFSDLAHRFFNVPAQPDEIVAAGPQRQVPVGVLSHGSAVPSRQPHHSVPSLAAQRRRLARRAEPAGGKTAGPGDTDLALIEAEAAAASAGRGAAPGAPLDPTVTAGASQRLEPGLAAQMGFA